MKELLEQYGIGCTAEALEKLTAFKQLLIEKNKVMDLTNVPEAEMDERHFLDSLLPFTVCELEPFSTLVDVGTGAGFPGLPAAILMPQVECTLIDAQQKRCLFLEEVAEKLALKNVRIRHLRAEDAGRDAALREQFDIACARAVAPMNVLEEYLLPMVKIGGSALCWKGPGIAEEMGNAKKAAFLLGGRITEPARMPIESAEHYIVRVVKTGKTPSIYPRKSGTPAKKPLGT